MQLELSKVASTDADVMLISLSADKLVLFALLLPLGTQHRSDVSVLFQAKTGMAELVCLVVLVSSLTLHQGSVNVSAQEF